MAWWTARCPSQSFLGVTRSPGSRTWVPSSRRLRLRAVLGSAVRLARLVAALVIGERPVAVWSASLLPISDCPCPSETRTPMTTPSTYRERVVQPSTRGSAGFLCDRNDTLASSARRGRVAAITLSGRLQTRFPPLAPRACFPRHRPIPSRVLPGTFKLCASWRTVRMSVKGLSLATTPCGRCPPPTPACATARLPRAGCLLPSKRTRIEG